MQDPSIEPATGFTEALDAPESHIARILGYVPRALSSKTHVLLLATLGVYLVVLPLLGITVSATAELIGGNYTNVTSDIGACIAAGGTLHLIRRNRRQHEHIRGLLEALHRHHNIEQPPTEPID
ncbi:MAG: hypothetical protein ACREQ5_00510 [Candidatus Dormibacteria bacterium]